DTKTPLTALLPGSTYSKTGEWERLAFPRDFQGLLDETTRALRGEHRIPVDPEGAYIRQLVLITEARRGVYNLWVDDLEIVEHIPSNRDALRLSERGARFNPTNLLSCRLKLTETPIFWRADDANDSNVYGEEPFAIDRKKAEENERVPLAFARDAVAPPLPPTRTPTPTSAAPGSTRPKASYEQALAVLPSLSPEPFATASPNALLAATPRSDDAVGQVAFAGSDAPNAARVASADYAADPTNGVQPPVESPTDELVSGSGTLADPFAAATEDFVRPGERLVANARFGSGGRLETENGRRVYALRAVESQNEPFAFLKNLGFNAVALPAPPTAAQLKEANDAKIWLIAPAPIGPETVSKVVFDANTASTETASLDEPDVDATRSAAKPQTVRADAPVPDYFAGTAATDAYDPVLLWQMGSLARSEIDAFRLQAEKIRLLDPRKRPLVGSVVDGVDGRVHHIRFPHLDATGDAAPGAIVELRMFEDGRGEHRLALAVRSDFDLPAQVTAVGATWLDRQAVGHVVASLSTAGFGAEVRQALHERADHLIGQGLATRQAGRVVLARNLIETLRRRDLDQTA
ncbi:MAG: DUF3363 domain-containing protein, partial [Thermoguttaceae bacterium]|nr:DUF3363 domain-containing protein [Thermoguttaceae bacterium]